MKKKILIIIIFTIFLSIFSLNACAYSNFNWKLLKSNSKYILQTAPNNIIANYNLALSYANTGQIDKAYDIINSFDGSINREEFNAAVQNYLKPLDQFSDTQNILLLNYAAFKEVINENYNEAINIFKFVIRNDPKNQWTRNHIAAAYLELEDYDNAFKYINSALKIKDNNYSHLLKAVIYYEKDNLIKAFFEASQAGSLVNSLLERN
ncbi:MULTISPECIES: lipopolysaccharide assembly protein LapB [unclassified Halanaerobium]|uniref:tetratricopeptide repeat protein n=1 Tax=unclassified Halanaerobium TaxID=2641197 RepID=UPI000E169A02|nr:MULTISPECIES: tetratricopeptide repeat protein [unclassified Halanaerobium]RCW51489.1 tetratricopeptide repeat protein [Halanaerobium sp. MA284_MarDTE_T2]RCW89277.1 tetratricopeptide repeat protein [Halanaerobium sp. DL-01]